MILFFGPPGSGKSVQGELLVKRNNWQWLSTGQLFRDSKDPEVLKQLATGELLSNELTNRVVEDALMRTDASKRVVLDGYPRNQLQAKWLEANMPKFGRKIVTIVVFNVPKQELIKRLAGRGRMEDEPKVIERRLEIYEQNTKPVVDYYRRQGIPISVIDGEGKVDVVHERIQMAVTKCLPQ